MIATSIEVSKIQFSVNPQTKPSGCNIPETDYWNNLSNGKVCRERFMMRSKNWCECLRWLSIVLACSAFPVLGTDADSQSDAILYHDAHLHPSNYIQEGISASTLLSMVGNRVGRIALMGIPLQQKWDYFVSGERAPDYYLRSAASLYYYSFVDAAIAADYLSLTEEQRSRIDPMITGFNATDMYASDHIKRVLLTFPGVFSGVGEFSVHKEFVSSKVAGHAASLHNPALDRIFETTAEIGLVTVIHCDTDNVRPGKVPDHFVDLMDLFRRHPNAVIIWAHTGLGRFVEPSVDHVAHIDSMMSDAGLAHVSADISWDLVNEYMVSSEESTNAWAALLNKHPTRFLFGSDAVAPRDWGSYIKSYRILKDLWARLEPSTKQQVTTGNYERIFDAAIPRIREWEAAALTETE